MTPTLETASFDFVFLWLSIYLKFFWVKYLYSLYIFLKFWSHPTLLDIKITIHYILSLMGLSGYFIISSKIIKMTPYKSLSKNAFQGNIYRCAKEFNHRDFITALFLVENDLNVKQNLFCYLKILQRQGPKFVHFFHLSFHFRTYLMALNIEGVQ